MRDDRQGSAAVPIEQLRELADRGRFWCAMGVVTARAGEAHFEIADGDVRVDVKLQSGEFLWARLGGFCGGPGVGIFTVPDAGAEVLVALPDGRKDGEGLVVAYASTGQLPDGLAGGGTLIIAVKPGKKVLVHDGTAGDAVPLCRKADHDGHKHPLPLMQVTCGNPGAVVPVVIAPGAGPGDTLGAPTVPGTATLAAK